MKTLIIALNSKYIHSSLAAWYLKAACGPECGEVSVLERTINDSPGVILSEIYREKPDAAAFSCYIWNITHVLELVSDLKKVLPGVAVILGGPEVSYDPEEILAGNSGVDYIIAGEGEESLPELIAHLAGKSGPAALEAIHGLCFRTPDGTSFSAPELIHELDSIPSPYSSEMLAGLTGRIVYYESSRGCPFSCSYCISSTFDGVRYFPMERVRQELTMLFEAGVRQVKFVDRTFNCNRSRAMEIFRHILRLYDEKLPGDGARPEINFHFEAAADLFDAEMLELLAHAPSGLIQLELGVQTVNEAALDAVNRRTDTGRLCENVRMLRKAGNINLHLDLIAGLPFEDFSSFRTSFDTVYTLEPHQLQLGFLKLLKGTDIRKRANMHGYAYTDRPPYEVLSGKYMSYGELTELKGVEELLDRYYNSGRFGNTLRFLLQYSGSAFDLYLGFYRFNLSKGRARLPAGLRDTYAMLLEYSDTVCGGKTDAVKEYMRLDFFLSESSGSLPSGIFTAEGSRPADGSNDFRDRCFAFLRDEENVRRHLPALSGLPAKEIYKKVRFEVFSLDVSHGSTEYDPGKMTVFLFDHTVRDRVSGLYSFSVLNTPLS